MLVHGEARDAMGKSATVPDVVQALTDDFLTAVDSEAPGLVEGLYLIGSVALADFQPRTSDVDFVAVTAERPDAGGIAALERAHRRLRAHWPRPFFDGIHVSWDDLGRAPAVCQAGPFAHAGRFGAADRFELNPVTWHVLAHHGVAFRGPPASTIGVWTDRDMLAGWTLDNLESYWRRWGQARSRLLSPAGISSLAAGAATWAVLGVSRLHYTLATGDITSKYGAGQYALGRFDARWQRIIRESLRLRRGEVSASLYQTAFGRRRDALAFLSMVIDDARHDGATGVNHG